MRLTQLYDDGQILAAADYAAGDLLYMVDVSETDPDLQSKATTYGDLATALFGGGTSIDAVFNSITGPGGLLRFGADATGVDSAALNFTATVGRSTGAAAPSAFLFRVGIQGASSAVLQTATEVLRLQEVANSGGREVAVMNVNGPFMSGLPLNYSPTVQFESTEDAARFGGRVKIFRANDYPIIRLIRMNGSYAAPTGVLASQSIGFVEFGGQASGGLPLSAAYISAYALENFTASARGSRLDFLTTSATTTGAVRRLRLSGTTTVDEWSSESVTLRLIPGSTAFVVRDSANTFDAHVFAASGLITSLSQGATSSDVLVGTGTGSGSSTLQIRGAAGTSRQIYFLTGAGSIRWQIRANNTAESGSNAGSDLAIAAYNDAGSVLDQPLTGVRALNGLWTFARPWAFTGTNAAGTNAQLVRIGGTSNPLSASARALRIDTTLNATANNDSLYGIDLAPAFVPGAFTGVSAVGMRIAGVTAAAATNYGILLAAVTGATTNYSIYGQGGTLRNDGPLQIAGTFTSALAVARIETTLTAASGTGRLMQIAGSSAAAANNDALAALFISSTFSVGAFTGTNAYGLFINGVSGAATNYAIFTNGGQVQFGDQTRVRSTTAIQWSVQYDASNRMDVTLSSAGAVTFDAVGASAGFAFSDGVAVTGQSSVTHNNASAIALTVSNASGGDQLSLSGFNNATVRFTATNAGSDIKNYRIYTNNSGQLRIQLVNDAVSATSDVFTVSRSTYLTATFAFTGDTAVTGILSSIATTASLVQSTTTGSLIVGTGTGSGQTDMRIRGAAGQLRQITFETASNTRWIVRADAAAEGGADAGSDLRWLARTDAGAAIDDPFVITRAANGSITLGGAGNRQVIIAGNAWGAGNASLRLNGLTNGAGAGAGTLANAPAAGNPTFWIPMNIAGTVRYVPSW